MKKTIVKILSCVVCVCLLLTTLVACAGTGKWTSTKMNNWGNVKSVGGFVAETDNYLYFIGGSTSSSGDNTFGTPVKGSLMVADRNDLSKTEIAVPKLFGATDYQAGLYIFGDYVYYGSPNTDLSSSGAVASTEMMFRRAKLDGSSDELLFKAGSLAYEYRVVKGADDNIYIVYYDTNASALKSFNATTKEEIVIAKTDETTEGLKSLASYKFLTNNMVNSAVVVYTVTVYSESYNKEMIENSGSARPTENYNMVYAYTVGDTLAENDEVVGKVIFDGSKQKNSNYTISKVDKNFVYIQRTNTYAITQMFALNKENIASANGENEVGVEVVASYVDRLYYTESLDKVYILDKTDAENVKLYTDTMIKAEKSASTRNLVARINTINTLLYTNGDYMYYYNTNNNLCRLNVNLQDEVKEERISEDSVAVTWYQPEIITLGEKEYIFYCDNSSLGNSYVKYVDLSNDIVSEDTDDNDEDDLFYIEGHEFFGKVLDEDYAKFIDVKIGNLSKGLTSTGILDFDTDANGAYILDANGNLQVSAIKEMRRVIEEDLTASVKEKIASSSMGQLEKYERAIEVANMFYTLEGIRKVEDENSTDFATFKTKYEQIKSEIDKYYSSGEYKDIGVYIDVNLKANYSKAQSLFEESDK